RRVLFRSNPGSPAPPWRCGRHPVPCRRPWPCRPPCTARLRSWRASAPADTGLCSSFLWYAEFGWAAPYSRPASAHGSFGSSAFSFAPILIVSGNRKAPGHDRGRGRRSALVLLLPPFVPLLQQLQDLLLHPLG